MPSILAQLERLISRIHAPSLRVQSSLSLSAFILTNIRLASFTPICARIKEYWRAKRAFDQLRRPNTYLIHFWYE